MKRLLLFPLFLLLELVKNNLAKSILFLVMFISFYCASTYYYDDAKFKTKTSDRNDKLHKLGI